MAQGLKRMPAMRETWVQSLGWEDPQYSRLDNPMDRGASWATVHGVTKSRTRLSDFTFTTGYSEHHVSEMSLYVFCAFLNCILRF